MKLITTQKMLLSHTFHYRGTPHIHHVQARSDLTPTAPLPTFTPIADRTKLDSHFDRNSKIALGVIITLGAFMFLYVLLTYYQKCCEQALQAQHEQLDIESQRGSIFRRDSILSGISGSKRGSSYHGSDIIGRRRRDSVTVARYETPKQKERRWWGSLAAHGSAVKADAAVPLNVFPPQSRPVRSLPRAYDDEGESPGMWTERGYEWGRIENEGQERLGGFQGAIWRTERMEAGLDVGAEGRMCRGRSG